MATRPDSDDDWDDDWEDDDAPDFAPSVRREAEPEADLDPDEVIAECRDRFTDAPRYFGSELRSKLKWPFPVWIWFDGDFRPYRLARKELLRDGVVVWGALIQANQVLFDPRETVSAPGEVLFCPDPRRRVHPAQLLQAASRVAELKGAKPRDRELRKFAEHLAAETTRAFGWPVPRQLSDGLPCVISSVFFPRHYLPGNRICGPLMPLVVLKDAPHYACPLHYGFWPKAYRAAWREGG